MKKLILFMIMIISLTMSYEIYAEENSENDVSEIQKILGLDLNSLLEYDITSLGDSEESIKKLVDEYSDDEMKEKILEILNSTEIKDISVDEIEKLLFKHKEDIESLEKYISETDK